MSINSVEKYYLRIPLREKLIMLPMRDTFLVLVIANIFRISLRLILAGKVQEIITVNSLQVDI